MSKWHLSRTRTRLKTARTAIGGIPMSDDVGMLALEIIWFLDAMIVQIDKRILASKENGR